MRRVTYQTILQAATPVAHHGETIGNHSLLMRRKVRQPDGRFSDVPHITGDTMRHGLREAAAYATLDAAGMLDDPRLSAGALNLLFAGGSIVGASGPSISLTGYREMCDVFPPLAILGGCAGNRVIPGRVDVGHADLICQESEHLIPSWAVESAGRISSQRAHVEVCQRVRMDPSMRPDKRRLLTDEARAYAEGRMLDHETASGAGDARGIEASKSSMLPRTYETIAAGSLFYWEATVTTYSALDEDTWHTMLGAFLAGCRVGGKRATGNGVLRPVEGATRGFEWRRPVDAAEFVSFEFAGSVFRSHVAGRADRLRSFLDGVVA